MWIISYQASENTNLFDVMRTDTCFNCLMHNISKWWWGTLRKSCNIYCNNFKVCLNILGSFAFEGLTSLFSFQVVQFEYPLLVFQATIMNACWVIIWLIALIFVGWPLGFICSGFYVCFLPFEVCIDPMKSINELLFKGVKIPYEIAKRMKSGKEGW